MKKQLITYAIAAIVLVMFSCKKNDDDSSSSNPATTTAAKSFSNITFDKTHAFFSTDGSMTTPVDSTTAKTFPNKIDITYFINWDYSEDGFLDPKTRSSHYYWDDYYASWLSTSVETKFYATTLTKADFDAAAADQSKIATYFARTSTFLVPHFIFPFGTCIGGRLCYNSAGDSTSMTLSSGYVFGFKNIASGKSGLLYMRTDQAALWPDPTLSTNTKVDIIKEN